MSIPISRLDLLAEDVGKHRILSHPFLTSLRAGHFSKDEIGTWIREQYYFSSSFPRCLAALYARISDYRVSLPLMRFLAIEHWGSPEPGAHWHMFSKVLSYFEIDATQLQLENPSPETAEYLAKRLDMCLTATLEEALGVVAYGHELINASIFDSYLAGVRSLIGVPEDVLAYFRAHVDDEPEDYRLLRGVIGNVVHDEHGVALVEKGAREILEARVRFFDVMLQRVSVGRAQD